MGQSLALQGYVAVLTAELRVDAGDALSRLCGGCGERSGRRSRADGRVGRGPEFVDSQYVRTMLVMGRQDNTVKPRNTRSLAARLVAFGVSVDTLWVDGEHGVSVGAFARPYRSKSEIVPRVRAF